MARVLVVEGEADIRALVQRALEHDGHQLTSVPTAVDGLHAVDRVRPDVIVLDDWTMLQELKRRPAAAGGEIPVVLFTGRSEPVDRATGAIEGAVVHVAKPAGVADLGRAITEALSAPEPVLRRRAQSRALETLARIEGEANGAGAGDATPRTRLSALERGPARVAPSQPAPTPDVLANLDALTDKQRLLLETLRRAPTVMEAASELQMSRSNVYASLRRIGRTLGTRSVTELLDVVRSGELA